MEDRVKYVRKLSDKFYNRIMLDVQAIISGNWE